MSTSKALISVAFAVLLLAMVVLADEYSHTYEIGEPVVVWAAAVGPHFNPLETYSYYTLPWCKPDTIETKSLSLGEALQGLEQVKTNFEVNFRVKEQKKVLCTTKFTSDLVDSFLNAVNNQYWYQFFVDELPMWEMVGGVAKERERSIPFIFTHRHFSIGFNKNQIVEVNLTAHNPVPIRDGAPLTFTYSATWVESQVEFSKRFIRYLDHNFFEHKIHWFSIFNSFMMVLFLSGLVFMILVRTLRADIAQSKDVEEGYDSDSDFSDDSGWKQLRGDVFRAPVMLELYAALIGTGIQITLIVFVLIIAAMMLSFYDTERRGTLLTTFVVLYSISSFVSGYVSGSYYLQHKAKNWIRTMLLTACLFPGVCFVTGSILNTIAILYGSVAAIPFGTMIAVISMWCLITVPLVLLGTIAGRSIGGKGEFPCRVNNISRPIPRKPWYLSRAVFVLLGGVLPFGSIFIEMYFVFTSFWNYKFYYVYGFMLLVYVILLIVTICVSIVSTYFLLNSEDYRWPWTSFLAGFSTGIYAFGYAIYFFAFKTKMNGLFQVSFYFGYSFLFCFGLGVLCGSIGFIGTNLFVRRIYRDLKFD